MDNILHNLRTQQKIQEKQHKSDLIRNKEPTCRLNWSEKRSRNKRSQIFFAALFFAYACYDVFLISVAFDGSVFVVVVVFRCCCCDDLNQKLWECIKPISFNISLCIYLNICHYFARAFLALHTYIYRSRTGRHKVEFFVRILLFCCCTLVMLQIRKITILTFSSLQNFTTF